jgi:hypothetical protein
MSSSMSRAACPRVRRVQAFRCGEGVEQELRLDAGLHRLQPRLEGAPRKLARSSSRALSLRAAATRVAER